MSRKYVLALCVGGLFLAASASAHPGARPGKSGVPVAVRHAMDRFAPGLKADAIAAAPLPGFYQIIAAGRLVYVSSDGKYLLYGSLVDLIHHKNLSTQAWASLRRTSLARIPAAQRIVFAPAHPKYTVTVFTDITCGFCRALHRQIDEINKEGIAVNYLAWPRSGVTGRDGKPAKTYKQMVSIWCSAHRKKALTAALAGHAPKPAHCDNPVKTEFNLGRKLGVNGTPAIVAEDGTLIGGYLTPKEMLEALRGHGKG